MPVIPSAERNKKFAAIVARVLDLDINEINPHGITFYWRAPSSGIGIAVIARETGHVMDYYDNNGNPHTMELTDEQAKTLNEALKQA